MATATELRLFGPAGLTLTPETWAPAGVTGADKVAQRAVYALLTPLGSVPGRPADGSPFASLARNWRSEFELFAAFTAAEPAVKATVQAAEADGDPAAERYGTFSLVGVEIDGDRVTLRLAATAADGSRPSTPTDVTMER